MLKKETGLYSVFEDHPNKGYIVTIRICWVFIYFQNYGVLEYWIQHDGCFLFFAVLQHSNTPVLADHYNNLTFGFKNTLVIGYRTVEKYIL